MLEEKDETDSDTSRYRSSRNISVWSGIILTVLLAFLSYILYLQVRLSFFLAPLSLDYDRYTKFGIISDLHLDLKQNSTACEWWNGTYFTHYQSEYGSTGCDTKYDFATVTVNSFSHLIDDVGNVDLVFCLGDFVNHYTTNYVDNRDVIANSSDLFHSKFDIPIYSTLGNNDMPEDYMQPSNSSQFFESIWMTISPMMNASTDVLAKHRAKETFVTGGYFTLEHSAELQIVSLNSITFSVRSNVNISSGMQQLQWLSEVLSNAAIHKRAVVIIGHICPSLSLYQVSRYKPNRTMMWKEDYISRYNDIVSAYSGVIKFTLFSHHHSYLWFVQQMQNHESKSSFVSYYVLPSISPVYENEPAFSIGVVDNQWNLLDIWNYFCPLSFYTRQDKEPKYLFQFSFKKSYFYYDDKNPGIVEDMPITDELLFTLTSRLLDVQDMQNTYKKILYNSYQFLYNFANVSPYQMFCIMTHNTVEGVKKCFSDYNFTF